MLLLSLLCLVHSVTYDKAAYEVDANLAAMSGDIAARHRVSIVDLKRYMPHTTDSGINFANAFRDAGIINFRYAEKRTKPEKVVQAFRVIEHSMSSSYPAAISLLLSLNVLPSYLNMAYLGDADWVAFTQFLLARRYAEGLRLVANAQGVQETTTPNEKRRCLLQFFLQVFCMQETHVFYEMGVEKSKLEGEIKADLLLACRQQLRVQERLNRLLLLGACVAPLTNCIVPFVPQSTVAYVSVPAAIISFIAIGFVVYSLIYQDQLTECVAREIDKNQKKWEQAADILSTFFMISRVQKAPWETFVGQKEIRRYRDATMVMNDFMQRVRQA